MRLLYTAIVVSLIITTGSNAQLSPVGLTCEYLKNPSVIDEPYPRLSWINKARPGDRGQKQTAWEIRVSESQETLITGDAGLWNSGKVISGESVNILYSGKKLHSRQECWWQVRVWDRDDKVSEWSEPAFWRMGLLDQTEWKALWIGAPWQGEEALAKPSNPGATMPDQLPPPAPLLRKSFTVGKEIASAVAYTTGLGYFEFYLNGLKVGSDVLVPNQTNYGKRPGLMSENIPLPDNFREYRVMYLAYDVKDLLLQGDNMAGAILGNGFFNPAKYWCAAYGTPRFILQLHITYTDGSEDVIVSDGSWTAAKSPLLMDMVYYGEHYDARLEINDWCLPGSKTEGWQGVALRKAPEGKMIAHMAEPDRVMEVIEPVSITETGQGRYKVDFGQEISGWVHFSNVKGEAGQKLEIKYLQPYTPNGENSYTFRGGVEESYHPRFTWFVFREVELVNWPGVLTKEKIKAELVYTNVETTGSFNSSNPLLSDINRIWWRSQTDNMHGGIASDCPNRERSPYTGDGQVACVTVIHNFDARAFYRKWIDDIIGASNEETGYVPNGAPWQPGCGGGVAWGAAISIMPWEFYLHYGDIQILEDSYDAMKGYVRYMLTWTDGEGIMFSQATGKNGKPLRWLNLGDWAQPFELPPDNMVHTFYLWRCADLTAKSAEMLGKKVESEQYYAIAERTRKAFHKKFFNPETGSYGPYGGNIFALRMGVPNDQKEKVIAALKKDIQLRDGHLDTGIFGTQFFFEVLAENGLNQLAYEAISKKTMPSYGYWLEQGATTSWEHFEKPGSGNHPMFGGGIVWLYRKLAGMNTDPASPGYRNIIFKPMPPEGIDWAEYSNITPFGRASIKWIKEPGRFVMNVEVPVGSTSDVYIPAASENLVWESGEKTSPAKGITFKGMDDGYAVFSTLSGKYKFESYDKPVAEAYDIIVYGGTSAGISAAIQSSRMGRKVLIIEPTNRLGGLTTGGLGQTDIGNKQAIGGISREFYSGIKKYYDDPLNWKWQRREEYLDGGQTRTERGEESMWTFEPSAACEVFRKMIMAESNISVVYNKRLDRANGVNTDRKQITAIAMESGEVYKARIFIDATYEGDLMAASGVSYTTGREANRKYGETLNGVQPDDTTRTKTGQRSLNAINHNFVAGVDPWRVKGDPSSGLLPFIDPEGPGKKGAGDKRIQAYCFRMCLTDHPENRIPFEKPSNYNEEDYELLFRNYEAGENQVPWINSGMPNRKTDTNNRRGFSTDFIGQNYDYPEADYATRQLIAQRHRDYQKGLMWSLAYHPRIPERIRNTVSKWGMCIDEFEEGNGWQNQLYVREARRMISDYVMTQDNCEGLRVAEDVAGLAAYGMDSHNVQRYVTGEGFVKNEGNVEARVSSPYPISYRSIVPKAKECSNLLVPVCVSSTHIAYGSIRMEPVFMVLGQTAAIAASIAIEDNLKVQDVSYDKLKELLIQNNQRLVWQPY